MSGSSPLGTPASVAAPVPPTSARVPLWRSALARPRNRLLIALVGAAAAAGASAFSVRVVDECDHVTVTRPPDDWLPRISSILTTPSRYQPWELERIDERNRSYEYRTPSMDNSPSHIISGLSFGIVGRLVMNGLNSLHVFDLHKLKSVISNREKDTGLLTISNHRSVLDDPLLIGAITPLHLSFRPQNLHWGTCAADICFREEKLRSLMTISKVLPIKRRGGIHQPELRDVALRLSAGHWVHYFPEGRIHQRAGVDRMRRGVAHLIASARQGSATGARLPIVVPIYHEGTDLLMPHDARTNHLFLNFPRSGQRVWAIVGDPMDFRELFQEHPGCFSSDVEQSQNPECTRLYDEICRRIAVQLRVLRAELRSRARVAHNVDLGESFEVS